MESILESESSSQSGPVTIRGRIEKIFFAGPEFSAGRLTTNSGEGITFAGHFFARENEPVLLNGRWVTHPKYGRQLEVDTMEYDLGLDAGGLTNYLAHHTEMKGIGPVKARLISEAFGRDFDRVIIDEPERVADIGKVSLETAHQIRTVWLKTKTINKVATRLAAYGLTHYQITTLVDKFKGDILGLLEADPYIVIGEVRNFGFRRVDKIARKMGTAKTDPSRIRAGILHCVNQALDEGHCWTEYEELIDQANLLLVMDDLDSRDRIDRELTFLIEKGSLSCSSFSGRFLIAKPDIQKMEEDLAAKLKNGQGPNPNFRDHEGFIEWIEHTAPELKQKQREAVLNALKHRISLITGGAGTGKTYTVSALVEMCEEGDLDILLAASTGKAAKRLQQLVNRPASTVHRLLGFDGKRYSLGPGNSIDADVLVIDEVSMMDTPLAWHLFQAIDLCRTAVVLVGDHNQLPPVGPGNILRDLTKSRAIPTVILDQIIRQAGILKENCAAVLNGELRKTSPPADSKSGPRPWYVLDRYTDQKDAQRCVLEIFESDLLGRLGFDPITDVQLLTPTHKGLLGTHELNIELQRITQKKIWDFDIQPSLPGRRPKFLIHDKVIQTRNNYETGIMNGTMGKVISALTGGGLVVDFEGELVEVEGEDLQDIQLAYCLTYHRVQGAEFPCVILVIHKSHAFMHHRNLLYTGVTRARQTAILIGDHWGMQNCAKQRKQNERRTFLSFLLQGENGGSDALR